MGFLERIKDALLGRRAPDALERTPPPGPERAGETADERREQRAAYGAGLDEERYRPEGQPRRED